MVSSYWCDNWNGSLRDWSQVYGWQKFVTIIVTFFVTIIVMFLKHNWRASQWHNPEKLREFLRQIPWGILISIVTVIIMFAIQFCLFTPKRLYDQESNQLAASALKMAELEYIRKDPTSLTYNNAYDPGGYIALGWQAFRNADYKNAISFFDVALLNPSSSARTHTPEVQVNACYFLCKLKKVYSGTGETSADKRACEDLNIDVKTMTAEIERAGKLKPPYDAFYDRDSLQTAIERFMTVISYAPPEVRASILTNVETIRTLQSQVPLKPQR